MGASRRRTIASFATALAALVTLRCSFFTDAGGLASEGTPPSSPDATADGPPSDGAAAGDAPLPDGGSVVDADAMAAADDGAPTTNAYAAAVLADGPAMYLRFEDTTGAVVDETGAHPASVVGNVGRGVPGAMNGSLAIELDGSPGAVTPGDVFSFDQTKPYTLEAWVQPTGGDLIFVFGKDDYDTNGREEYGLFFAAQDAGPYMLAFERFVSDTWAGTNTPITAGWHHVVGTYDGVKLALFLDGAELGGASDTRSAAVKATPFFVGASRMASNYTFVGRIDEAAVYEKALAADRIHAHYVLGAAAR